MEFMNRIINRLLSALNRGPVRPRSKTNPRSTAGRSARSATLFVGSTPKTAVRAARAADGMVSHNSTGDRWRRGHAD
jgi:hypothetical protein